MGNGIARIANIAIFASGAGSNASKIIEHFEQPEQSKLGKVTLIVSNKSSAGVLGIATQHQVQTLIIEKEKFFRGDGYVHELQEHYIDFIVLAGFLWKVPATIINAYPGRILNIHPALLPKYGGKGMYGGVVHAAVIAAGEKESGITIHLVDEQYDNGDIVLQAKCIVQEHDTPDSLAERIHFLEHLHYPKEVEDCLRKLLKAGV
ncbi:MAG: phosphoribosylglycinamide formyltransferase [Segetibacter sp.]|nr:phosphoribosylglycinamide formyltransferase [Segetibacter sp.]